MFVLSKFGDDLYICVCVVVLKCLIGWCYYVVMKIVIEGCCYGEFDVIYVVIVYLEVVEKVKIDLLICCGDF